MSDPMDTIRDIVYPGYRAPVTPISDIDHKAEAEEILANRASMNDPNGLALDIQAVGDDLRDRDDYTDYGFGLPYPPRPQDLA